ncbi:MAG: tryptophan synthase subunit alpha [Acidimicrobiia bacterium]|nr:tryptophan synthase subunit alpha [Acidimicrobiia bacterium]
MAERLRRTFTDAAAADRAVLLPYMTAGLPGPDTSLDMFKAMAEAGADGFEVGIPYSDPLMDGPTIHEAGLRAINAGATVGSSLQLVESVVAGTGKPVVVMTYVNPILAIGVDVFCNRVASAGGSGLIVADLPADESDEIAAACAAAGLGLVLFVAPTTDDERLAQVVARKPLFVYGIAELGVTGKREQASSHAAELTSRIKAVTKVPVVLGVGISGPESAAAAAGVADGVIVGSALVRRVLDAASPAQAAADLSSAVAALAASMHRS